MSEELTLIYNKALDILSRREHSTKELVIKLEKKFTSNTDILLTVSKLKKNNLLNDIRFTESYVAARKRKGSVLDVAFYATGYSIAFALVILVITLIIHRNFL